jgi:hypothetical protein
MEGMTMFCEKCGTQLEDGKTVCPQCGFDAGSVKKHSEAAEGAAVGAAASEASKEEQKTAAEATAPAGDAVAFGEGVPVQVKKPLFKKLAFIIPVCIVLVAAIAFCAYWFGGKAALKKQLLKDWYYADETSYGTSYMLELDFSDDSVEYNFVSVYITQTIATLDYKVFAPNKKSYGPYDRVITISFNSDKTMMTFTPAMTSTDSSEYWFNLD